MNKKLLLGTTFAAVFVLAMMANPVFAVSKAFQIDEAEGFTMSTVGNIGTATEGHAVVVYVFFTADEGDDGQIVYVAAVHPSFNDDPDEQAPGNKMIHAHQLELDDDLCVVAINNDPSLVKTKKSVSITDAEHDDDDVIAHAIVGYDVTENGLCPTELYDSIDL